MLKLVKIECVLGKLDMQNTPCTSGWLIQVAVIMQPTRRPIYTYKVSSTICAVSFGSTHYLFIIIFFPSFGSNVLFAYYIDLPVIHIFQALYIIYILFSGALATVSVLSYGVYQLKTGDSKMSQKMMRWRIGAQAFTIVALLGGVYYQGFKENRRKKLEKSQT
jgi:hypothetical protein